MTPRSQFPRTGRGLQPAEETTGSSFDLFILDAELRDQPSITEPSDDFAILVNVQIGSP